MITQQSEEDKRLMERLGLAPVELCHATAYHVWNDGQRPGDSELILDRDMYCHVDEFNSPFFMPLNEPCPSDRWEPVGIRISANTKKDGLGKMFSFEYFIPRGRKLRLVGSEQSVVVGTLGNEREAPVYRYELA